MKNTFSIFFLILCFLGETVVSVKSMPPMLFEKGKLTENKITEKQREQKKLENSEEEQRHRILDFDFNNSYLSATKKGVITETRENNTSLANEESRYQFNTLSMMQKLYNKFSTSECPDLEKGEADEEVSEIKNLPAEKINELYKQEVVSIQAKNALQKATILAEEAKKEQEELELLENSYTALLQEDDSKSISIFNQFLVKAEDIDYYLNESLSYIKAAKELAPESTFVQWSLEAAQYRKLSWDHQLCIIRACKIQSIATLIVIASQDLHRVLWDEATNEWLKALDISQVLYRLAPEKLKSSWVRSIRAKELIVEIAQGIRDGRINQNGGKEDFLGKVLSFSQQESKVNPVFVQEMKKQFEKAEQTKDKFFSNNIKFPVNNQKNDELKGETRIKLIEKVIHHSFSDKSLIKEALTHSSYASENGQSFNNERLEFLGDVVLNLIISQNLFKQFPHFTVGKLSQARSSLTCGKSLQDYAKLLGLQNHLLLSKGELNNINKNSSILSDAFESVIGAIYLDAGLLAAEDFILKNINIDKHESITSSFKNEIINPKGELQELLISEGLPPPKYELDKEEGKDNEKKFHYKILVGEKIFSFGNGASKKEAQANAARELLNKIRIESLKEI